MKRLMLIRHAKSSWANPGLTDMERPLNNRGLRDAPAMAKYLRENDIQAHTSDQQPLLEGPMPQHNTFMKSLQMVAS